MWINPPWSWSSLLMPSCCPLLCASFLKSAWHWPSETPCCPASPGRIQDSCVLSPQRIFHPSRVPCPSPPKTSDRSWPLSGCSAPHARWSISCTVLSIHPPGIPAEPCWTNKDARRQWTVWPRHHRHRILKNSRPCTSTIRKGYPLPWSCPWPLPCRYVSQTAWSRSAVWSRYLSGYYTCLPAPRSPSSLSPGSRNEVPVSVWVCRPYSHTGFPACCPNCIR